MEGGNLNKNLLCCVDDFTTQTGGLICFYSLKNPSFPE